MLKLRPVFFFLLLLLAAPAPTQTPAPAPIATAIAPGVSYRHLQEKTPAGEPWSIHVLEVNRKEKSVEIRAAAGRGDDGAMQRERPTTMAQRVAATGANVVAVVNGDYDLPAPYLGVSDGLAVTSGEIWTTGKPTWPNFAFLRSGEPIIGVPEVTLALSAGKRRVPIAALNKPFGSAWGDGARLYTRAFRLVLKTEAPFDAAVIMQLSTPLPLRVGSTVRGVVQEGHRGMKEFPVPPGALVLACPSRQQYPPETAKFYCGLRLGENVRLPAEVRMGGKKDVRHAIGGFPILVENGRRSIVGTPSENLRRRHPRTATCTNTQKIIFVVVDGRQPQLSVGMTLEELADLMVSLGCTTAMNTDGGGSSVMAIAQSGSGSGVRPPLQIVNSPSDGPERGRGNAWVIIRR